MQGGQLLSTEEVARILGKTQQRVRQVAAAGGFPGAFHLGDRYWVIPRAGLEEYQRTAKQRKRKRKGETVEG